MIILIIAGWCWYKFTPAQRRARRKDWPAIYLNVMIELLMWAVIYTLVKS